MTKHSLHYLFYKIDSLGSSYNHPNQNKYHQLPRWIRSKDTLSQDWSHSSFFGSRALLEFSCLPSYLTSSTAPSIFLFISFPWSVRTWWSGWLTPFVAYAVSAIFSILSLTAFRHLRYMVETKILLQWIVKKYFGLINHDETNSSRNEFVLIELIHNYLF